MIDIRQFARKWWVYLAGRPYRLATRDEVTAHLLRAQLTEGSDDDD